MNCGVCPFDRNYTVFTYNQAVEEFEKYQPEMSDTVTVDKKLFIELQALVKEMKTQETDCQAFPRFWSPRSSKWVVSTDDGDDSEPRVYEHGELYTFDEYREYKEVTDEKLPDEMIICNEYCQHYEIVYERLQKFCEQNHSFFKSDVEGFIKFNSHHLGEDPHTYGNSVWRMPRMERLMNLIMEIGVE
jgi:hypothetical protein